MVALGIKRVTATLLAAAFVAVTGFAQQPQARLAGLERNADYMALLRRDADLVHRIDSLTTAVYDLREVIYSDDSKRKERSAELLAMENDLYTLRDDRIRLVDRINAIEQEWLLANISTGVASQDEATDEPETDGVQYADLIKNRYFSRSLSRSDYDALRQARDNEVAAARLYAAFAEAHADLVGARALYDSVAVESEADSAYVRLMSKYEACTTLSDSLHSVWSSAFDNKSYLYDLLFDKDGRDDMLDRTEKSVFAMRQGVAKVAGEYASDAVVEYVLGKRCIHDYEVNVARAAGLTAALDSLGRAASSLDGLRYDFAKVDVRKRMFIDYSPVKFSSRYVYNSSNPVPECTEYEYGVVCRIKLGEYRVQQPAAKFKGLEPVSYRRTASGGWAYYAGCYRSVEALENALKTVKRLGFTDADVAAWSDGAYADGREEVEALLSEHYSIEITGADELPEEVCDVIEADENNSGVVRTGRGVFTVGGLASREEADALAAAISAADGSLSVTVVETPAAK